MPNMSKIKVYEDELVENIREAISKNDEIKIWNLSLGTNNEADFYEYSDFAKSLDEIQERYSVLICKSAGNCTNFRVNKPKSRISKSADTVRGLVVGSISKDKISTDLVEKNHPSPFSRIGPGPSHLIKPDVVHIGGNAGIDSYQNIRFLSVQNLADEDLYEISKLKNLVSLTIFKSKITFVPYIPSLVMKNSENQKYN